jgi:hypothetical protein
LPGHRPLHRSILLEALVGLQWQFASPLGPQPGAMDGHFAASPDHIARLMPMTVGDLSATIVSIIFRTLVRVVVV